MHRNLFTFIVLICVLCGTGFSGNILVPSHYGTIQEAIDAAVEDPDPLLSDVVVVSDGNYPECIDFKGKAITVRSESNDPRYALIDGSGFAGKSVVDFHSGEGTDSVLKGFTITGGSGYFGGGIECNSSSPTIENCIIKENTAERDGGGIDCFNSGAVFADCVISLNNPGRDGGGISVYECNSSSPSFFNCLIYGNSSIGKGGAVYVYNSSNISFSNCTVVDNVSQHTVDEFSLNTYGGIYVNDGSNQSSILIKNSILWGNVIDLSAPGCIVDHSTVQFSDNALQIYDKDPGFTEGLLVIIIFAR